MARYGDEIPKCGKRQERENEREIEACCFWPQKVVERERRGDRGKRAVHTDGAAGCQVTCYNRAGHHVSGAEYDDAGKTEYEGIRQKSVPTIERRGARDIIRGCHNRDKVRQRMKGSATRSSYFLTRRMND